MESVGTMQTENQTKNKANNIFKAIKGFREGTLILIILAVCIIMSFVSPYFLTWPNLKAILLSFSTEGIVVVGMTLILVVGGFDLSVGSVMCLAMVIGGKLFVHWDLAQRKILRQFHCDAAPTFAFDWNSMRAVSSTWYQDGPNLWDGPMASPPRCSGAAFQPARPPSWIFSTGSPGSSPGKTWHWRPREWQPPGPKTLPWPSLPNCADTPRFCSSLALTMVSAYSMLGMLRSPWPLTVTSSTNPAEPGAVTWELLSRPTRMRSVHSSSRRRPPTSCY